MRITFVSNYINHHQMPFSEACFRRLEGEYFFIQTEPMEAERVAMGWAGEVGQLSYVRNWEEQEALCRQLILESDITIFGWSSKEAEMDRLVHQRLEQGRPVLRVSERLYREGQWKAISPKGLIRKYHQHIRYRRKPAYLLCAGAYVASDFHLIGAYPGKMFRFGYFPETIPYTMDQLDKEKPQGGRVELLWAGRLIPLKHPEFALRIAGELKQEGVDFHLHLAGGGEMEACLRQEAAAAGLEDVVTFYGYRQPGEIRRLMEKSHIFLFTSNHLEGWGAVVNEAMNSGCAVVAGSQAGAVPYLIRHGENGLVYHGGSYEDYARLVRQLVAQPEEIRRLGAEACRTITECWNAETAAERLLDFCRNLLQGRVVPAEQGPMSPAPVWRLPGTKRKEDRGWNRK